VSSDGQVKEKDVTLAVSLRIKERLERRNPSVKVELTRSDDSFLTVSERTVLANSFNADLFISIHCNSYSDSRAKGVETYYLSKASSHAAMVVAARENSIPLEKMTDVEATLLDLMMTSKKTESHKLANAVHQALVRVLAGPTRSRRDRGVKRAPFYVLLGATMPAILVECAYISNVKEKDRLTSSRYLNLVAEGICDGAQIYLRGLGEGG
jgi:N-acetylmuramoyl-L-alanine amidase